MKTTFVGCTGVLVMLAVFAGTGFAQCEFEWDSGFCPPGTNDSVRAWAVFDDGTGPALYFGGSFTAAGGVSASRIAKWDGTSWSPLGSGLNNAVYALAVYNDGTGAALYAGGLFTTAGGATANRIAKWNGTTWSPLVVGSSNGLGSTVFALTAYAGYLCAGGAFADAGGEALADRLAFWDGAAWHAASDTGGPDYDVLAMLSWDGGLYVGGNFTKIGTTNANRIAAWNGSAWSAFGTGMNNSVRAIAIYNDGLGPAVYAGGDFTKAGGTTINRIAKWADAAWSTVGTDGMNDSVRALMVHDDGTGPALFAGGAFSTAGGAGASGIGRWNGTSWSAVGTGINNTVYTLAVHNDGRGSALYAGGYFTTAGGGWSSRVARWNGASWSGLGNGVSPSGNIYALTVTDDGTGPALYAGGDFDHVGGVYAPGVARSKGSTWSGVGTLSSSADVRVLSVLDYGGGPALFAGGAMTIGGGTDNCIGRWDGAAWASAGCGMNYPASALAVFDDGGGSALYVGGSFTQISGSPFNRVAKWNGTAWSALGSGANNTVNALLVTDSGAGTALHAGGSFTSAGGQSSPGSATWNGSTWSALGGGSSTVVSAYLVFDDDGAGPHAPALYAARSHDVAKWNPGSPGSWTTVGGGTDFAVLSLAGFDDGNGPALYAGGLFTKIGGVTAQSIAKWDGTQWQPLGAGLVGTAAGARALAVFDDGSGPALYVGGNFSTAGGKPSANIAKWSAKQVKPGITQAPASLSKKIGESAVFTVAASGTQPLSYRWRKDTVPLDDGGNISGAFTPTLTIDPVGQADGGEYDVVVTNVCGSTPSTVATLTVTTSLGDFDADGDVDLTDFGQFRTCFNGPNRSPAAADCDASDFDGDSDVDLTDFGQFRTCFNGPNRPPNCQ